MAKPEHEFFPVTQVGWTKVPGADVGMTERVLAKDPNANVATRILTFPPGCDTTPNGVQVHDFWEEVYILEGSFTDLELNAKAEALIEPVLAGRTGALRKAVSDLPKAADLAALIAAVSA